MEVHALARKRIAAASEGDPNGSPFFFAQTQTRMVMLSLKKID
jgi:hypothetical protein